MPRPPLASGERAWQLYGQLNLGYMTFDEPPDRPATGDALRRLLRLYLSEEAAVLRRQVEALRSATAAPVNRRLPPHFPQPFGRGIECTLTFDESGFDGMSPYTFGLVLERYVARHVSERSFTTTVLCSTQRGRITHWPPRAGTRGAA